MSPCSKTAFADCLPANSCTANSQAVSLTFFLDSEDHTLLEVSLSNNVVGASKIKEHIIRFYDLIEYERIIVGMEATSVYSFHPSTFLAEDAELKSLGIEVVVMNPKAIHRFKGLFEEDKTDKIDAYRIADFLRFDRFNSSLIKEEKYMALQRLTRSRYQLVGQLTEMKQHFLENLYYKCNTLSKEIDTSVFGSTMMDLLTDSMTLEDIANMSLEDLAAILQEKGRGGFSNPQKLAKALSKAVRDSYRLGKVMQDSVDVVLASYAMMIKTLKKQIKELDKAIEQLFEILPESKSLLSIPGIGPVFAGGIIAEIGQIHRFEDEAVNVKYFFTNFDK